LFPNLQKDAQLLEEKHKVKQLEDMLLEMKAKMDRVDQTVKGPLTGSNSEQPWADAREEWRSQELDAKLHATEAALEQMTRNAEDANEAVRQLTLAKEEMSIEIRQKENSLEEKDIAILKLEKEMSRLRATSHIIDKPTSQKSSATEEEEALCHCGCRIQVKYCLVHYGISLPHPNLRCRLTGCPLSVWFVEEDFSKTEEGLLLVPQSAHCRVQPMWTRETSKYYMYVNVQYRVPIFKRRYWFFPCRVPPRRRIALYRYRFGLPGPGSGVVAVINEPIKLAWMGAVISLLLTMSGMAFINNVIVRDNFIVTES